MIQLKIKQHQDIGLVKCGKEYGRRKKLTMSRLLKRGSNLFRDGKRFGS